jgi:hypothetical protein
MLYAPTGAAASACAPSALRESNKATAPFQNGAILIPAGKTHADFPIFRGVEGERRAVRFEQRRDLRRFWPSARSRKSGSIDPRYAVPSGAAKVMKRYYSKAHLAGMREKLQTVGPKTDNLMLRFGTHRFLVEKGREYANHGFLRRIQTFRRCIENVFRIVPPGAVKVPSRVRLHDAQINIQAAVVNTYGCVDNLAWVWVYERGLKVGPRQVGFRKHNVPVRQSLSKDFRSFLEERDEWFDYIADYRHALGHRIPLYIPPGSVLKKDHEMFYELQRQMNDALNNFRPYEYERLLVEQSKLLVFQPMVGHSFGEMEAPYRFHPQLLSDFLTIEELALKVLDEL